MKKATPRIDLALVLDQIVSTRQVKHIEDSLWKAYSN